MPVRSLVVLATERCAGRKRWADRELQGPRGDDGRAVREAVDGMVAI
jgi:hypothetical protein